MNKSDRFFKEKTNTIGVTLNNVQKEAVETTEGPLLLLASPGSGKTTTLIMRIGYLIEVLGVPVHKIKAVTFSKASANDMKERFSRFFPECEPVAFSTIHSLAFGIVRKQFQREGTDFELVEGKVRLPSLQKRYLIRTIYNQLHEELITEDQLEELSSLISFVKNKRLKMKDWENVKTTIPNAHEVMKRYEQYKQTGTERLLLDFDDMLTVANDILEEDAHVLESYRSRYDYVLTDESQDTSLIQHALIEKLVQKHQNLCVVADDDQSIYAWRAAEPQYLLDFKKTYPNATILKMEQNYRSTSGIVDTANQFIKQNKNRYDKNMFTDNPPGEPVQLTYLRDYKEQVEYVIKEINKQVTFRDSAVLYRNNSSAIALINAFDKAGIPFYMKDADNRFFSHWIVKDILNFMRLVYDQSRIDILERVHTKFNAYISKKQIAYLQSNSSEGTVFEKLLKDPAIKPYQLTAIKKCKEIFAEMKDVKPFQIIRKIRFDLGYQEMLRKMGEELGFNIDNLLNILYTLEDIALQEETMESFAKRLAYLENLMRESRHNHETDAVTFSTFHSSKGLEFCYVYMIDLIKGVIPAATDETEEQLEEAVRLFYVGMTRAKMHLNLYAYQKKHGKAVEMSPYFNEVYKLVHPEKVEKRIQIPLEGTPAIETKLRMKKHIPQNPNAVKEASKLQVGLQVKHRVFGTGEITSIDDDCLKIQFVKEEKLLMIDTCIEMGVLEIV